jgi:hypothetical protein
MTGFGLVWVKINGHIRQNLYFLKNATGDSLKIAWTFNTFTVSGAWERWEIQSRRGGFFWLIDNGRLMGDPFVFAG